MHEPSRKYSLTRGWVCFPLSLVTVVVGVCKLFPFIRNRHICGLEQQCLGNCSVVWWVCRTLNVKNNSTATFTGVGRCFVSGFWCSSEGGRSLEGSWARVGRKGENEGKGGKDSEAQHQCLHQQVLWLQWITTRTVEAPEEFSLSRYPG